LLADHFTLFVGSSLSSEIRMVLHPLFSRRAFTLVELLVVIGIIALLIGILLPALTKAREQSRSVACGSNARQLMMAVRLFAQDNQNSLPGGYYDRTNADERKRDWLLGGFASSVAEFINGPQAGTIFKYTNSLGIYRCPSRDDITPRARGGSNGRFDYGLFQVFSGAKITNIRPTARFKYPDGRSEWLPTPVICDEDPAWGINGNNLEGGHANTDKMAKTHNGGSYYASIDGSITFFKEHPDANAHNWFLVAPSNAEKGLGTGTTTWGFWNKQ